MSLQKLLKWHYFTVQTNEGTVNDGGALTRKHGWLNLYENLRGHLQTVPSQRNDENLQFHRKTVEVHNILFHGYTDKEIATNKRILVWNNPKLPIEHWDDIPNIRIFNIISIKEPVALRGNKTLFELHLEEVLKPRQSV